MLNTNHLTMQEKAELLARLLQHNDLTYDEEEWCTYQINLRAAMIPRREPSEWWYATSDHDDCLEELLTISLDIDDLEGDDLDVYLR